MNSREGERDGNRRKRGRKGAEGREREEEQQSKQPQHGAMRKRKCVAVVAGTWQQRSYAEVTADLRTAGC